MAAKGDTADREIVLSRVVSAPRELVFDVWTDPKHVVKWWGPNGFTTTTQSMEVKPGGVWRFCMHGPDGRDYGNKITYVEVVRPERLVYKHSGEGDTESLKFDVTVTFEDAGGKTRVTIRSIFPTAEARDFVVKTHGAIEGGKQHLDRLEAQVAGMLAAGRPARPFVIARTFDAPRDLVWKAWTEPQRMSKWWGPKGVTVESLTIELRVGCLNHYRMMTPEGQVMWGKMVYREITAPSWMVFVNSFSDEKAGITRHPWNAMWPLELLSTITFVEQGAKTTVTIEWLPINASDEELAAFEAGRDSMTQGWGGSLDQLTAYLRGVGG